MQHVHWPQWKVVCITTSNTILDHHVDYIVLQSISIWVYMGMIFPRDPYTLAIYMALRCRMPSVAGLWIWMKVQLAVQGTVVIDGNM